MPKLIGKYEILTTLGSGAMGVVYQARDPIIDRVVAVKVLSPSLLENPKQRERFYQEARTAGNLRHTNIVVIHDCGEHEGVPYIVMEYLDGEDLREQIEHKTAWNLGQKLNVISQICSGLKHAHNKQVVHRDMKPGNVRILPDGTVKILDFGIARLTTSAQTQTSSLLGTVSYMSPELCTLGVASPATDIWAVGVILYELLCYHRPFEANHNIAVIHRIVSEQPVPITDYWPGCPDGLRRIVEKALEKDVERRHRSADDLRNDVDRFAASLQIAETQPTLAPLAPPVQVPPAEEQIAPAPESLDARSTGEGETVLQPAAFPPAPPPFEPGPAPVSPARLVDAAPVERAVPPPWESRPEPLPPPWMPAVEAPPEGGTPILTELPAEQTAVRSADNAPGEGGAFVFADNPPEEATVLVRPAEATDEPAWSDMPRQFESPAADQTVLARATTAERVGKPRLTSPAAGSRKWVRWAVPVLVLGIAGTLFLILSQGPSRSPEPPQVPVKVDRQATGPASLSSGTTTVVPTPAPFSLNVAPWAEVVSVKDSQGKEIESLRGRTTPTRLLLPPGRYSLVLRNRQIAPHDLTVSIEVPEKGGGELTTSFPDYDADRAAESFKER